jgi:hypothetical protein
MAAHKSWWPGPQTFGQIDDEIRQTRRELREARLQNLNRSPTPNANTKLTKNFLKKNIINQLANSAPDEHFDVIEEYLKRKGLECYFDRENQQRNTLAYLVHRPGHWFALRKLRDGTFTQYDSMSHGPVHIANLSAYKTARREDGYTFFPVKLL